MKIIKKILRFISLGSLGAILAAVIWYNWPQKQEDRFLYLPEKALVYGQLCIDWREKGPAEFFAVFWKKLTAKNPQLSNSLARKIVLSRLPQDVLFSVIYDQNYARLKKQPDYVVIIDLGKKTRLVRLALDIASLKGINLVKSKSLIISNNLLVLKSVAINQTSPAAETATIRALFKPYTREELTVYITNKHGELSKFAKYMEEKNNFSFFPSIDLIEYMQISGKLTTADQIKGKISFVSKYIADVDKIGVDALFLNNMLMRMLLGAGFTYEGDVTSLANFVEINYQVHDLNKIWRQIQ
ncbi:MAG: hypothetical protein HY920_03455 [Elusimicrobia bacterium]|nr:hypothetical protein [Elusimicrobiota bacterium]